MAMHDINGNLVTARSIAELQYNYTFELMARGGAVALRTGNWEQFRAFHLISFCTESSLKGNCF
jgi:hypothetical protein